MLIISIFHFFEIPHCVRNDGVCFEGKGGNNGGSKGAAVVSTALPRKLPSFRQSAAKEESFPSCYFAGDVSPTLWGLVAKQC
jgi:hypothetical protein